MFFDYFTRHSPSENKKFLAEYLKDFGYAGALKELHPLHEHEECFYYQTDSLYIKITPRVAAEISHLHYLMQKDLPFVLPTLFGTSVKKGILITQAIEDPHFMVKQADRLIAKQITLQQFLAAEFEVLKCIQKVHQFEVGGEASFPDYGKFISHTYSQMQKEPIAKILDLPIVLNGETYPSIKEMVDEKLRKSVAHCKERLIHGEFSHTNVGLHQNEIIIYDWEKMRRGDPCWDIAKWIKFFTPFYFVLKAREKASIESLEIDQKVRINIPIPQFPFKEQILEKILFFFSDNLQIPLSNLKDRVSLALFLSNLLSLRKAELKFNQTLPLMIVCFINN